jgi:hypothetical protein
VSSTFLLRLAGAAVAAATVLPAVPAMAVGSAPEGVGRPTAPQDGISRPTAPVVRGLDLACPADRVTGGGFGDVAGTHAPAIDCLAFYGVTKGGADGTFGAGKAVTRAQMATFLTRVLERADVALPADAADAFTDDDGSTHEASLDALAALGVVNGAGDGTVSPDAAVRRDQMASFLTRLLELITDEELAEAVEDYFDDTRGSVHRGPINALAGLGIAAGRAKGIFDPSSEVRRDQMATFLMRLVDRLVEKGDVKVPLALHLSAKEVVPGQVVTARVVGDGITAASIAGCGFDGTVGAATDEGWTFELVVPAGWPVEVEDEEPAEEEPAEEEPAEEEPAEEESSEEEPAEEESSEEESTEEESAETVEAASGDEAEVEDECEFTVTVTFADGTTDEVDGELEFAEAEEADEAEESEEADETEGDEPEGDTEGDEAEGDEAEGDTEGDETEGDETEGDETEGDETEGDSEGDETEGDETEGDEAEGDETEGDTEATV